MTTATQLQKALDEIGGEFVPCSFRRNGQIVNRLLLVVNGYGNKTVKTNASNKLKLEVVAEEKARLAMVVTPSNATPENLIEWGGEEFEKVVSAMKDDKDLLADLLGA